MPSPARTRTTLHLPPAQQRFLKDHLPQLKCGGFNECVTLELNGQIAVRSRESDAAPPMQLTLTRASYTGDPMRLVASRRYLQRAMELGFQEVSFIDPESVIVCRDGRRDYVWMAVDPKSAIQATPDTVEIASPDAIELRTRRKWRQMSVSVPSTSEVPTPTMAQPPIPSPTPERVRRQKPARNTARTSLIEQCHSVRLKLRELLTETNDLIRTAKRQKQQERLVRSTLANLRQMQTTE